MAGVGDEADEQDNTEGADATLPVNRKTKKLFPARTGVPHFKRRLRWNLFKWCLFIANTIVSYLPFSHLNEKKGWNLNAIFIISTPPTLLGL